MFHLNVDAMSIVVIVVLIVGAGLALSVVSPQVVAISNSVADIQHADQRAQLRIANEDAATKAQIEAINAVTAVSQTIAAKNIAQIGIDRQVADTNSQVALMNTKTQNDVALINANYGWITPVVFGSLGLLVVISVGGSGFYFVRSRAQYLDSQNRQRELALAVYQKNGGAVEFHSDGKVVIRSEVINPAPLALPEPQTPVISSQSWVRVPAVSIPATSKPETIASER